PLSGHPPGQCPQCSVLRIHSPAMLPVELQPVQRE
ncbi:hypothetical protein NPIL_442031, partial [Nephila pilipes]